jgi:heme-degrading monooxygenase HmoA
MAIAIIQTATEVPWEDYERVRRAIGDDVPAGLIAHAAGKTDSGTWRSVSIWKSQEAFERFNESVMPIAARELGEDVANAGPPPTETFEVLDLVRG